MRRAAAAILAASVLLIPAVMAVPAQATAGPASHDLNGPGDAPPTGPLTAQYRVLPYQATQAGLSPSAAAVATIPMFSRTVSSGGTSFPYKQVGKNPFVALANPVSTVPVKVIPLDITFTATGDVYDPTTTACSPSGAPTALLAKSPLEQSRAYSVGATAVSTGQYADFVRRAEYFTKVKPGALNPGYHVNLTFTKLAKVSLNANNFPENGTSCGRLGLIDISVLDQYIQQTLMPSLAAQGVGPTVFPFFLLKNVVLYQGTSSNCCIIGYHSAFNNPNFSNGFQTYGVGSFDTSGRFAGLHDISAITHEVSEWLDDPTGTNPTPAWGHIGQVSGCQSNLEVGDPLSGTTLSIAMNGFTYHPQEMAFSSWFYPGSTNTGVNHKFSSNGTFTTAAAACS